MPYNGEFCCQRLARSNTTVFEQLDQLVCACSADEGRIKTLRPRRSRRMRRPGERYDRLHRERPQDAYDMGVIDSLSTSSSDGSAPRTPRSSTTSPSTSSTTLRHRLHRHEPRGFRRPQRAKRQNYELIYDRRHDRRRAQRRREMFHATCTIACSKICGSDAKTRPSSCITSPTSPRNRRRSTLRPYLAPPDQIVVDYMASMTDNFTSCGSYAHLFPEGDERVITRDYCSDLRF